MSVRDELLAAIAAGDDEALRRAGWSEIWDALETWWALPKGGCPMSGLKPYAKALGNEDPAVILEAIEAGCDGKFRPAAGELRGYLNKSRIGDGSRVSTGRNRSREKTPETLEDVAKLHRAGQPACTCGWHRSQWSADPGTWVRRCPACDGLEPGQLYAAEDLDLMEVA